MHAPWWAQRADRAVSYEKTVRRAVPEASPRFSRVVGRWLANFAPRVGQENVRAVNAPDLTATIDRESSFILRTWGFFPSPCSFAPLAIAFISLRLQREQRAPPSSARREKRKLRRRHHGEEERRPQGIFELRCRRRRKASGRAVAYFICRHRRHRGGGHRPPMRLGEISHYGTREEQDTEDGLPLPRRGRRRAARC